MLVGAARADMTPPLGTSLAGYFHDRRASGIYDPLYARALVLGADDEALAIVALDLIGLPRTQVEQTRRRAHDLCGIAPERVMIHCTHTHLGPVTIPLFQSAFDPEWPESVSAKGAQSVAAAWRAREDREFAVATGKVESISFNRRYWMKSGTVATNPGRGNPEIVRPAGPIDPEVGVLIWGKPGKPAALLVAFTCHLDTIGGDLISADYPAYMAAHLRDRLGDVAVVFLNGAFGDINHVDVNDPAPRAGLAQAKWMGEVLGEEVLRVLPQAEGSGSQALGEMHRMLEIPLRPLPESVLEPARRTLIGAPPVGAMNSEQMYAREILLLAESEKPPLDSARDGRAAPLGGPELVEGPQITAEVQVVRVGDAALVGLPGEPFVELGLRLKRGSPFPHTYVVGLANGCEGYIPTRAAFDEGGYEVRTARSSKLHPDAGDLLVGAGAELLREMWGAT